MQLQLMTFNPLNSLRKYLTFQLLTTQSRLLTTIKKKPFENIMRKGENTGNQHFLLLPQCFLLYQKIRDHIFLLEFNLLTANPLNSVLSKHLSLGKVLNWYDKGQKELIY